VLFDAVEVGTPVSITDAPSNLNNPEPEAVTKIETRVEAKPKPPVITAKLKPQPQPQPVQISPRRRSDSQGAHSVTYHNGVPVFSE
jgi:hypothetical protein